MKKSAHAHSAMIQNRQFRARIARKDNSGENEISEKKALNIRFLVFPRLKNWR